MKIAEIEKIFKDLFSEDGLVQSVDTVYELSEDEQFYKLVISLQNLSFEDTLIIHTKFIFKTDLEKVNIIDNSFLYLYDINCIYHKIDFKSAIDASDKIKEIITENRFGEDIKILSDFCEAPAMFLNYYMRRAKITDYSIFEVKYEPKFKTTPCDKMTFDFEVNINNNYQIEVSIYKIDHKSDDLKEKDSYKMTFKFMDEIKTYEADSLNNIHYFIGSNLATLLDTKLKGK